MNDPVEIRWPGGSVRVAYVGGGRWRRDGSRMPLRELVDAIGKRVLAAPGRVDFVAPGVEETIEVIRRADLVGVLPAGLLPLDVTSPTKEPFVAFATKWLGWHCERCWPDDVERPADRIGERFSAAAFAASSNPSALVAELDAALAARVRGAGDPENVVNTVIRELAALGHTATFADGDGRWSVWVSQWVMISFEPPRTTSVSAAQEGSRSE